MVSCSKVLSLTVLSQQFPLIQKILSIGDGPNWTMEFTSRVAGQGKFPNVRCVADKAKLKEVDETFARTRSTVIIKQNFPVFPVFTPLKPKDAPIRSAVKRLEEKLLAHFNESGGPVPTSFRNDLVTMKWATRKLVAQLDSLFPPAPSGERGGSPGYGEEITDNGRK